MPSIGIALVIALVFAAAPAAADLAADGSWPAGAATPGVPAKVTSASPFSLADLDAGLPPVAADVRFYPAEGASAARPAPAVILLHGAGGVSGRREGRYAREFTAQGVAVAVIDVFGARGGGRFIERLIKITESMALADAFATKAWLAARPDIDADRIALIGFSYGAMSTTYAAYRQVAEPFAAAFGTTPFAAHVAFYGPCVARFEDVAATGAPLLMLWGEHDAIIDPEACEATAADLARGGAPVTIRRYDAAHRWDGAGRSWRAPTHIADCRFTVGRDGTVRDDNSFFVMDGPVGRTAMLALCANSDGYRIAGDEDVRRRSNAAMARFLNPVLFSRSTPEG
ncbi:MAG: hypothetical protein AcusKO_35840 [Acuticoccus sp.]